MPHRQAGTAGHRHDSPLTVKLGDVVQLPAIPQPCRRQQRRRRPSGAAIVAAILADAASAAHNHTAVVVAVPPAAPGDPTLLFLRSGGTTRAMLGVPAEVIRSPRLRGEGHRRDRQAERQWEYLRVAEARAHYDADDVSDDDNLDPEY